MHEEDEDVAKVDEAADREASAAGRSTDEETATGEAEEAAPSDSPELGADLLGAIAESDDAETEPVAEDVLASPIDESKHDAGAALASEPVGADDVTASDSDTAPTVVDDPVVPDSDGSSAASALTTSEPDVETATLVDDAPAGTEAESIEADAASSEDETAPGSEATAEDDATAVELPSAASTDEAVAVEHADAAPADEAAAVEIVPDADDVEPLAEDAAAEVDERLLGILESVLFACGEPITLARLMEVVAGPTRAEMRAALAALGARSERDRRGIRLVEVAGGWQFRTAPEHGEWVRRLFQQRPWRLTRATLETLAIVAYKQPITRAEVEAIRGVDVDSVLASLLARKLVKIVGRKEVIGRPLLYGTTRQFLEVFGLRDLAALPGLSEVASAMPESVAAGAAAGDENAWSSDDRNDEGHPPAEAAGGLGDVLATGGGDADPERAGDRERQNGHDPGDPGAPD